MTTPRPLLLSAGIMLIAVAARALIRSCRTPAAIPVAGLSRGLVLRIGGSLVCRAARLSRSMGWLRRRGDATQLCTRLAIAPACWPARSIAAAHQALTARGDRASMDLAELMRGLRLCSAVALALLGACSWPLLGAVPAAGLAAVCAAAGAVLPDLALGMAARRSRRSSQEDAAAVDLLAAASAAGIGLTASFALAAEHAPPRAAAAIRAATLRVATGADPRAVLSTEAARFSVPVLADAGDAVDRARRLGVPLGAELRAIATRRRAEQRAHLLERAARRGPLGTLVVALVIAPVCLAALTACLVGGLVESGGLPIR